jgi:hypothetical protein
MRILIINLVIFVVALLLLFFLGGIGIVYGVFKHLKSFKLFDYLGRIMYSINVGIDQIGNVLLGEFLDATCLVDKDVRKRFGRVDETISHVLAINERDGNLKDFGHKIVGVLEFLDPGHMDKSL